MHLGSVPSWKHAWAAMGQLNIVNPWSWYAIAASEQVARGQVLPIVLNGTPLVTWRPQSDKISVWSDRCPHRGMRLSLGATRDDILICPYHGWVFGADGACTHIPAHPKLTPSRAARARIYPVTESNGYIWACLGEPATPQPALPTKAGNALSHVRTIHVSADIETVVASLMTRPLLDDGDSPDWTGETFEWRSEDAAVITHRNGARPFFSARLTFPGFLSCEAAGPQGSIRYAALVQPTLPTASAIHLAIDGGTGEAGALPMALNRGLVRLRQQLQSRAYDAALAVAAERCAALMPDQIHG